MEVLTKKQAKTKFFTNKRSGKFFQGWDHSGLFVSKIDFQQSNVKIYLRLTELHTRSNINHEKQALYQRA